MSSHKSTKKGGAAPAVLPSDPESLVRFAELLKLRSLALSTQAEYLRYIRKLAARAKCDPAGLDEAQVREHLLHLKVAHAYSPSSMRTAVAAMRAYYGLLLGWMHPAAKKRRMIVETLLAVVIVVRPKLDAGEPWHLRCPHCGAFTLVCVGKIPRSPPACER